MVSAMGTNLGNGFGSGGGGNEMGGGIQSNGSHLPHATEYTLQGQFKFVNLLSYAS
jgi:hypothetical protein